MLECDISGHFPIVSHFKCSSIYRNDIIPSQKIKYKWQNEYAEDFLCKQYDSTTIDMILDFYDKLSIKVDGAIPSLCEILHDISDKMK